MPALSPVHATHDSPRGMVSAAWSVEGDLVRYDLEVPDSSSGLLRLRSEYRNTRLDNKPIDTGRDHGLSPGRHVVTFNYTETPRDTARGPDINARTP
uniref:alpha-L-rhamnosidase C-terminal domain-containing protein n=1 Tax=Devosia pacifica TaxID=1335967 RepID=UPI001FCEBC1E